MRELSGAASERAVAWEKFAKRIATALSLKLKNEPNVQMLDAQGKVISQVTSGKIP